MKKLRGKHHYKSYKELCAALDIDPAPRGQEREKQKRSIAKLYQMDVHANNSIDLTRIPQKKATRQDKLDQGQIRVIDGREVDLGSNLLYQDTCIDQLILYRALMAKDRIDTKEGFVISCFDRTKFFRELLDRDSLESGNYSVESIHLVHELVVSRLFAMVNTRLARFEEKGYIRTRRYYLLKGNSEASIEEVQPYVNQALKEMKLKREFQAYANKDCREKFLDLRSSLYERNGGRPIISKKFHIEPLIHLEARDSYEDEDGMVIADLTNKDIQIILTSFFDIFREKAIYDFEKKTNPKNAKTRVSLDYIRECKFRKEHFEEVAEIVNTYCAYMNRPINDIAQAFYSIKELEEYYGETIDFSIALDYSHDTDETKYEEGDVADFYDEIDGDGKKQYNFYTLSNLTEEENADRKARLKKQEEALEKFVQHELSERGQIQEC